MMDELVALLTTLAGVTAVITFAVNTAAFFGWVKDGQKGDLNDALQVGVLLLLWALKTFWPAVDIGILDVYAAQIAELGVAVVAFIALVLKLSHGTHDAVAGRVPVVGFSYSAGSTNVQDLLDEFK